MTDFMFRNVTEVFKTPGKLRGKTPRTVRKVPGLDSRVVSACPIYPDNGDLIACSL